MAVSRMRRLQMYRYIYYNYNYTSVARSGRRPQRLRILGDPAE